MILSPRRTVILFTQLGMIMSCVELSIVEFDLKSKLKIEVWFELEIYDLLNLKFNSNLKEKSNLELSSTHF